MERLTIGLVETITFGDGRKIKAKIDTGADLSSIDINLSKKLGIDKILSYKTIRSALGKHKRPIINVEFEFKDKKFTEKFTVSDRVGLKYKILIGKDILIKEKFLVDPLKK